MEKRERPERQRTYQPDKVPPAPFPGAHVTSIHHPQQVQQTPPLTVQNTIETSPRCEMPPKSEHRKIPTPRAREEQHSELRQFATDFKLAESSNQDTPLLSRKQHQQDHHATAPSLPHHPTSHQNIHQQSHQQPHQQQAHQQTHQPQHQQQTHQQTHQPNHPHSSPPQIQQQTIQLQPIQQQSHQSPLQEDIVTTNKPSPNPTPIQVTPPPMQQQSQQSPPRQQQASSPSQIIQIQSQIQTTPPNQNQQDSMEKVTNNFKKSTLNPNAKEFNPSAKPFTTVIILIIYF